MPVLERDGAEIHYDVYGEGYPLVLFAAGGMHSAAHFWHDFGVDRTNPIVDLAGDFQVVAMDQRNAGRSTAPVRSGDGWDTYTADHLALIDHLGFESVHVMGGCIGASYCLSLCRAVPDRITAAILQNPIGISGGNNHVFAAMFDSWAAGLATGRDRPSEEVLTGMRERLFGGDFVFSVDRDFVRECRVPLLVLAGDDIYHPQPVAREIADLAPDARLLVEWTGPERHDATVGRMRQFLLDHTPQPH